MGDHAVVSREDWVAARTQLLEKEKQLTRLRDELSRERRSLPWVKIDTQYVYDGPEGKETLADLFTGRSQLIIHHLMFSPDWEEGCVGCSFHSDHDEGALVHLENHDVSFVRVSRAPLAKINAFNKRMGWHANWVSSSDSSFNRDFADVYLFTGEWLATFRSPVDGYPFSGPNNINGYFGMWNDTPQKNRNYIWKNFANKNQVILIYQYLVYYPRQRRNLRLDPVNGIGSKPDPRYDNFRDNLGHLVRYSRKLNLINVTAMSNLSSTKFCRAQTRTPARNTWFTSRPEAHSLWIFPQCRTRVCSPLNGSTRRRERHYPGKRFLPGHASSRSPRLSADTRCCTWSIPRVTGDIACFGSFPPCPESIRRHRPLNSGVGSAPCQGRHVSNWEQLRGRGTDKGTPLILKLKPNSQ